MKNLGSDGERVKSFIPSSDTFIILVFLVVFCVLQLFFFFFSLLETQFGNSKIDSACLQTETSVQILWVQTTFW